jgi:hypothetical protein
MKDTLKNILGLGILAIGGYAVYMYFKNKNTTSTSNTNTTTTPTPTPTPEVEKRTIFWNFSTIGVNNFPSLVNFKIQQNGKNILDTTTPIQDNTHYISQIQDWDKLQVNVGDTITVMVYVLRSGSNGNTTGSVFVASTNGNTGYIKDIGANPQLTNQVVIANQSVGDMDKTSQPITFKVQSGLNYVVYCDYIQ